MKVDQQNPGGQAIDGPGDGANAVGVDDSEEPGDELYLIGHFDTVVEAEKAQKQRKKKHSNELTYIYEPETM